MWFIKMIQRKLFLVGSSFLILLCVIFSLQSYAQEPIKAVAFTGTPWFDLSDQHQGQGIVPQYFKALSERSGLSIYLKAQPYPRMIHNLEAGNADVAIFFRSAKSESVAIPAQKITTLSTVVIANTPNMFLQYNDLRNYKIAVKRGVFYDPQFDLDMDLDKVSVGNYAESVHLFSLGRVGAVVGSKVSLDFHFAREKHFARNVSHPLILRQKDVYFQFAKKSALSQEIREKLLETLNEMVNEGLYEKLIEEAIQFSKINLK